MTVKETIDQNLNKFVEKCEVLTASGYKYIALDRTKMYNSNNNVDITAVSCGAKALCDELKENSDEYTLQALLQVKLHDATMDLENHIHETGVIDNETIKQFTGLEKFVLNAF